jgi:hypothetical protein
MEDTSVKKISNTKPIGKLITDTRPDIALPVAISDMPTIEALPKKVRKPTSESTLLALKRGRELRAAKIEAKREAKRATSEPAVPVAKPEPVEVIKEKKVKQSIKGDLAELKSLLIEKQAVAPVVAEPVVREVPVVKEVVREVPVVKEVVREVVLSGSALLDNLFFKR